MPVTLICQYVPCSKPFPVKDSRKDKSRFCSTTCKKQAMVIPVRMKICPECGQEFPLMGKQRYTDGPHFCARSCSAKFTGREKRGKNLDRFWTRVQICSHGFDCIFCCWPWLGPVGPKGYGRIVIQQTKQTFTHRVAWSLHNQIPLSKDLIIGHYCHNIICTNFDHLHGGTQLDNITDSVRDLRHAFGERNAQHKITEADIPIIFQLRREGLTLDAIGKRMNVSFQTIHKVLNGQLWGHVPIYPSTAPAETTLETYAPAGTSISNF